MKPEDKLKYTSMTNLEALEYVLAMAKKYSIDEPIAKYIKPELQAEFCIQQIAMKKADCFLRNLKFLKITL